MDASERKHLEEFLGAGLNYLGSHARHRAKKMGNTEGLQGLCILLLILTSIFVVLVIIASLICALKFGTGCDGILDQLINQAYPP